MLLDAHTHIAEVSPCSRVPAEKFIDICIADKIDAIVLTNHYKASAVRGEFSAWREKYVDEYEKTRELGAKKGLKVFFGVEFTLDENHRNDYTVYGLPMDVIRKSDPLYTMTLPELSAFVHGYDALLYHAHPYRNTTPADGTLLDGTEVNCHPLYRGCREKDVRAFADRYGLRLSCGSDYHGDTYKPHCGMIVPDSLETTEDFVAFLKAVPRPPLVVTPDPTPDMDISPGTGKPPFSYYG